MDEGTPLYHPSLRLFFALALILSVLFAEGINNTVPYAILPTEAAFKGVSQTVVGLIMGAFNLSRCIFTIPLLTFVNPRSIKECFILGAVISGICCVIFGELILISSTKLFVWCCIITRIIMGVGTAMIWASMTSLALSYYPHSEGTILALLQMFIASGELVGPPFTSLLFVIGGYYLPYVVAGSVQCVLAICYFFASPQQNEETQSSKEPTFTNRWSIFKFIFCPGILVISSPMFFGTAFMGFLSSAFAMHLLDVFEIGQSSAGIYFISYTLADIVSVLFFGKLVDRGYSGIAYSVGTFVHILVILGIYLPVVFPALNNMFFLQCMLAIAGVCLEALLVCGFPIYDVIAQQNNVDSPEQIKIFCSAWQGVMFAGGNLIGQTLVGGLFYEYFDFYKSCLLLSAIGITAFFLSFSYLARNNLLWKISVQPTSTAGDDNREKTYLMQSK